MEKMTPTERKMLIKLLWAAIISGLVVATVDVLTKEILQHFLR